MVLRVALEKDRDRRYQTALDFAEDLRRARVSEPILARPAGPILRLRRWAGRQPALATALTGLFLALGTGLAIVLFLLSSRDRTLVELRLADTEKDTALSNLSAAVELESKARIAKDAALRSLQGRQLLLHAESLLPRDPGTALLLAIEGAQRVPGVQANEVLDRVLLANRELRTFGGSGASIVAMNFNADAQLFADARADRTIHVTDVQTGVIRLSLGPLPNHVDHLVLSPTGDRLLGVDSGSSNYARVFEVSTGRELWKVAYSGLLRPPSFSTNGQAVLLVTSESNPLAGLRAQILDSSSGTEKFSLGEGVKDAVDARFTPDARLLCMTLRNGKLRCVDTSNDLPPREIDAPGYFIEGFSELGKSILISNDVYAVNEADQTFYRTKRRNQTLTAVAIHSGNRRNSIALDGAMLAIRQRLQRNDDRNVMPSSEDQLISLESNGSARLWNIESGAALTDFEESDDVITLCAISRDGSRVVTGTEDGVVRLFSATDGRSLGVLSVLGAPILSLDFDSGGKTIVGAIADGTVRVWSAVKVYPQILLTERARCKSSQLSEDGTRAVLVLNDHSAYVVDIN